MSEQGKPILERTLLALLLIQLQEMTSDQAADILIRAGWTNPEIADVIGATANAVAVRRSRMKKGKAKK